MTHLSVIATRLAAAALPLLLTGCGVLSLGGGGSVDRDNFYDQYAEISCKQNRDCFKGYYESQWDSNSDCVDDLMVGFQDFVDYYADCSFDADTAQSCLDTVKSAECAALYDEDPSIFEDCDAVWICD